MAPQDAGPSELFNETLVQGAHALGLELDDRMIRQFGTYAAELATWNHRFNLTAIRDPQEVVTRHFLDSLTCVKGYDFSLGRPVIDVGSGAGFPGIPLKIQFANLPLTLLESSGKKAEFLRHICRLIELGDVDVVHTRAEDLGHAGMYRQRFHACISRAVAPLPVLAELCMPFVVLGGYFIAQKNRELGEEWEAGQTALERLGGSPPELIPVSPPGEDLERALVISRKERSTPDAYPRRPGIPARRPLGAISQALPRRSPGRRPKWD